MLKLLLATDGSPNATRAAGHVADLARRGITVEAIVCHVRSPIMSGEVGTIAPVEIAESRRSREAAAAFEAALAALGDACINVSIHEATGDAAAEIVGAAQALGCDGIVVGRRGLGLLAGLLLGSVSARVARDSPLPVTFVE